VATLRKKGTSATPARDDLPTVPGAKPGVETELT